MTKNDMIAAIAENTGLTKKDVGAVIDTLTGVVTDALVAGDKVTLPGLCTFETVDVPEKTGKIMLGARKGESYTVEAHRSPKVKAVGALKNAVKGL
jgi:DNA-binding protein HU-beta